MADTTTQAAITPADSAESDVPVDQLPMAPDVELESDTVELDRVVPHPGNPRRVLGDLADLIPSIRTQGVIQPPVVLPAARVAAVWPEHAQALADAEFVVLVGHRRRAAAARAGRTRIPVLIRRDAIADDRLAQLDAMIGENTARKALTPVEEARAFAEQIAGGRKQYEVATRAGRSQSHVSKRLALLQLPPQMLAQLETGQALDADDDEDQDAPEREPLEIQDALAYVRESGGDQFVMLAAHKLAPHRRHWSVADLCREVRREQARRTQREALTKKAQDEGVPLIDDPEKRFGGYWKAREQRLEGKKAIAAARKAGTLAAHITDGGLAYYSTATKPPKKTDNRSEAEEQRITDERERRKAMTARAEAAAGLAAAAPKLPEAAAADIVDAWLYAPGNDVAQLAHKWLLAAGVGPDAALPHYRWWEQVRRGDWRTRVHAAHALALARHECHARATYHTWDQHDAAWLARLREQAGYIISPWEQARLDAIGTPLPAGRPQVAALTYDPDGDQCWVLYLDLAADEPAAWAGHLEDPDEGADAQSWAEALLNDEYGLDVTGWQPGQLGDRPAQLATFAADDDDDHDEDVGAGGELVDQDDAAPAGPGEYRLLYSGIDGLWMLLHDDEHLADHDGLHEDDLDGACNWATTVAGVDCDRQVQGWQSRVGAGAGGTEYVAEFVPAAGRPAKRSAEPPAPRLAWTQDHGWAVHTGASAEPVASTGPDIQAEDPVAAQTWAAEQLGYDGVEVVRWTAAPDGQPGYTAVVAS